ncbi:hypothetical protein [Cryobacterium sp.]|uniref:hypothetical protein n=1 Tax=Cryobacterium sp. TaxID=1926290 RepID=UPI00260B42EA|nr:hypothetical protein [Cryobacterium sp.]MCU1447640.1 hypothetical protein [Cryobacterium sp.]
MAHVTDDDRPTGEPTAPQPLERGEQPFQALFPNLDRMSRSAFRPGTVSRRRVGRSAGLLLAVAVVIAALVGASLLF